MKKVLMVPCSAKEAATPDAQCEYTPLRWRSFGAGVTEVPDRNHDDEEWRICKLALRKSSKHTGFGLLGNL